MCNPPILKIAFRRAKLKNFAFFSSAKDIRNQVKLGSLLIFIYSDCLSVLVFSNDILYVPM